MDLFEFDKVVNDIYAENGGTTKLFNKAVRPRILSKHQFGLTTIMFGPTS